MNLPKFIITMDGYLRLSMVNQHKDLLMGDDQCIGGGYYQFDWTSNRLILDRASYDFGRPRWHLLDTLRVPAQYRGLRIVGLGGSYRYRDGKYMYTEHEMKRRLFRLGYTLRRRGGLDILLTHAPMHGLNDLDDLPHRGFNCFHRLLDRWHPACFVHGHVHRNYGVQIPQRCTYGDTLVINAYEHCVIELDEKKLHTRG